VKKAEKTIQRHELRQVYPFYETVDRFLFARTEATISAPHVRDAINLKRIAVIVVIALLPVIFMALYNTGLQANLALAELGISSAAGWRGMVLASFGFATADPDSMAGNLLYGALQFLPIFTVNLVVAGFWTILFAVIRKRSIDEMFVITALLFSLALPPTIPLWQAALGISFALVFGKEVFGGLGMNIMNPSLVGLAFLYFAYPAHVSGETVWVAVDGISRATPLTAFTCPNLNISATWTDSFLGLIPGTMGETSALACLIGAAILIVTGIGSWRIMLSISGGMVGLSLFFNLIGSQSNQMFQVTPMWHLVIGSFAFATVFMATDPVTSAQTLQGQYYYGILIGVLAVLIRVINPALTEGMALAILFGNVFAPAIDKAVINRNIKRRLRRTHAG